MKHLAILWQLLSLRIDFTGVPTFVYIWNVYKKHFEIILELKESNGKGLN